MSVTKDFIIFSLENCPYCNLAYNLVINNKQQYINFTVDDIASNIDKQTLKDNVSKLIGKDVTTFPIIFTSEMEFIGGYDDLEEFFHKIKLSEIN